MFSLKLLPFFPSAFYNENMNTAGQALKPCNSKSDFGPAPLQNPQDMIKNYICINFFILSESAEFGGTRFFLPWL